MEQQRDDRSRRPRREDWQAGASFQGGLMDTTGPILACWALLARGSSGPAFRFVAGPGYIAIVGCEGRPLEAAMRSHALKHLRATRQRT